MATTSSFSKVKDSPSSHPVVREQKFFFGQTVFCLALKEKEKGENEDCGDEEMQSPRKTKKQKQAGTSGKLVSHY